ncbi:S49 family peptidase [Deinococcus radiophilus]|uniref:S49 family peptidase n=1 Tax=Deinococcus radiophilus TaxID=32062 RepID=A0A3S0I9W3_9DEIO|nr:S49 family peptidase [Deinococcus radiophilus]RTR30793.1 S49 family peptidase [Deinococcus radiophilus]UFA49375.1 S49 family peptidase [Deinococcus radiophilus]
MSINIPFLPRSSDLPKGVSRPTWVVIDLRGDYPARQPQQPLRALLRRDETLEALQQRLDILAEVDWLHGVLFRFSDLRVSATAARSIRDMLARLGEKKRVVAYLPQLSMTSLLAASGAGELVAPDSAEVGLHGFGLEQLYLGDFLKKNGIGFENLRVREYKSALTTLSENHMDDANREQLQAYLDACENAWVHDVAESLGQDEAQVRGWIEGGLTDAHEAFQAGILTKVAYEDELIGPATQPLSAVLDLLPTPAPRKAGRVAVVTLEGNIVTGTSKNNPLPLPFTGGPSAGSDTVIAALRHAKEDETTKAIVLYVNSGGGSALASDLIWREVLTSKKPVVAVMGNMAASGGYYVLAAADWVMASPYTVTGSIGVVAGRPVTEEFNRRHGLNPEQLGREEALMYLSSHPFTDRQREQVKKMIAGIYERFVDRVAQGRNLSHEQVDDLGRGRIWSGADALERGLVDELGDLHTAIERAKELAGLPYSAPAWNAAPKTRWPLLPEFAREAKDAAHVSLWPFGRETVLLLSEHDVKLS